VKARQCQLLKNDLSVSVEPIGMQHDRFVSNHELCLDHVNYEKHYIE